MEGVLDWVLRELFSEVGGLDRMVTEFVRVIDRLLPAHVFYRYSPELKNRGQTLGGTPVFIQLLGGQPAPMAENAAFAAELGAPGIDLNFGCPAKTVNRHDGGAALLREPERVFRVTEAVRAAVPSAIPVTAKVRLGFENKEFHREIAEACEKGGAAHVVVHARTKQEMYTPPAHWEYIHRMREGRAIPIIANGDIWTVEDYLRCVSIAGVTDVALGRGLVRRPTLARDIRAAVQLQRGFLPSAAEPFDAIDFLRRFFQASLNYREASYAVARMKQILRYWTPADKRYEAWFNQAKVLHSLPEMQRFLDTLPQENSWSPFKSIPGQTAPTASAQKIC